MNKILSDQSCGDFAAELASRAPVPGGGGAAALVGALGTALCSMAGNLTLGRKKYADVEPDILRLLEQGESLRRELLALVDEDAAAFEPLSRAYSIPKDAPHRDQVLAQATLNAITAPMEILRGCCRAIALLEEMEEKGSVMLISDVGCGAMLCRAALESASLNVFVNTRILADRTRAAAIESETDELLTEYKTRAAGVAERVMARLRG